MQSGPWADFLGAWPEEGSLLSLATQGGPPFSQVSRFRTELSDPLGQTLSGGKRYLLNECIKVTRRVSDIGPTWLVSSKEKKTFLRTRTILDKKDYNPWSSLNRFSLPFKNQPNIFKITTKQQQNNTTKNGWGLKNSPFPLEKKRPEKYTKAYPLGLNYLIVCLVENQFIIVHQADRLADICRWGEPLQPPGSGPKSPEATFWGWETC